MKDEDNRKIVLRHYPKWTGKLTQMCVCVCVIYLSNRQKKSKARENNVFYIFFFFNIISFLSSSIRLVLNINCITSNKNAIYQATNLSIYPQHTHTHTHNLNAYAFVNKFTLLTNLIFVNIYICKIVEIFRKHPCASYSYLK